MIFGLDKDFNIIEPLGDTVISASATLEINKQSYLDFTLPLDDALDENVRYFVVPYPDKPDDYLLYEYKSKEDNGDTTTYTGEELAYNELATDNYIKDRRPEDMQADEVMKLALEGSTWQVGNFINTTRIKVNFYYVSNLEAISLVTNAGGGEVRFYVQITGNKITGRYVDYLKQQGSDNGAWFEYDDTVLTIDRKEDRTQIYSRILPRGKGEQVSEGETPDTPDGYGRRITIEDIVWTKPNNPLDKHAGDPILENPAATEAYPNLSGKGKLLLKTYDDIEDKELLIEAAYADLMALSRPLVQYSAEIADVGELALGDVITISHPNPLLSFKTRVFKVVYDIMDPLNTSVTLGDNLSSQSSIDRLNQVVTTQQRQNDQINWNFTHAQGHGGTNYGPDEPSNPQQGDVWFKQLPDGKTELYYYDGEKWVLSASTDSQWDENHAVTLGDVTTYYGPVDPTTTGAEPKDGDVWFRQPQNGDPESTNRWIADHWVEVNGLGDANGLFGAIDGNNLAIRNISASNITSGHLSANFIQGGQIDASQINVINLNANNITTGTLDTTYIRVVGSDADMWMVNGIIEINSNHTNNFSRIEIGNKNISFRTTNYDDDINELGFEESIGGVNVQYIEQSSGDNNVNGVSLWVDTWDGVLGSFHAGDFVGFSSVASRNADGTPKTWDLPVYYNASGVYSEIGLHLQGPVIISGGKSWKEGNAQDFKWYSTTLYGNTYTSMLSHDGRSGIIFAGENLWKMNQGVPSAVG